MEPIINLLIKGKEWFLFFYFFFLLHYPLLLCAGSDLWGSSERLSVSCYQCGIVSQGTLSMMQQRKWPFHPMGVPLQALIPLIMWKSFSMVAIDSRRAREPQPTWTVWDLSCQAKRPDSHNPAELRGRTLAFSACCWLLVAVGTVALCC